MNSLFLPKIQKLISDIDIMEAEKLAARILGKASVSEIEALL
jgi:hypothetical protein